MSGASSTRRKHDERIDKLRVEISKLRRLLQYYYEAHGLLADYVTDLRCAKRDAIANGGDDYYDYLTMFETIEEREQQAESLLNTGRPAASKAPSRREQVQAATKRLKAK